MCADFIQYVLIDAVAAAAIKNATILKLEINESIDKLDIDGIQQQFSEKLIIMPQSSFGNSMLHLQPEIMRPSCLVRIMTKKMKF